ncbi:MAG: hypothetical protein C0483_06700 [Pirellula sp.]|nr:hypothetical protein [Pirellula sp.]
MHSNLGQPRATEQQRSAHSNHPADVALGRHNGINNRPADEYPASEAHTPLGELPMRYVVAVLFTVTLSSCDGAGIPSVDSAASPPAATAAPKTFDDQHSAKLKASPTAESDRPKYEPSEVEHAAVREALLRHQFKRNASGAQQNAKAYFIQIDDKDPDDAFLNRFDGHAPPVRLGSQFRVGDGLLFHVEAFKWIDANTVEASGGYYEANLSSSGNSYRLERKNGVWQVTVDKMNWIS